MRPRLSLIRSATRKGTLMERARLYWDRNPLTVGILARDSGG
jgi:hypothetical protein